MHRSRSAVGLVLVLAGLLPAGCTDPPSVPPPPTATPSPTVAGVPLPVRVTGPPAGLLAAGSARDRLEPDPGPDAPFLDQVLFELRAETLETARVWGRTSARCAGDRIVVAAGAVTRCTVTYEGLAVPYEVTIDKDYAPTGRNQFVSYVAYPQKVVVRAEAVYGYARELWNRPGEDPRCTRVPALRVLPYGFTGDRCQHVDLDGRRQTERVVIDGDGRVGFSP